jgi:hypothetical protein
VKAGLQLPEGDGRRLRRAGLAVAALTVSALGTGTLAAGAAQAAGPASPGGAQIRITEVAYGGKIAGADGDGEYVELTNVGTAAQDFAGWTYTGKAGAGTLPLDGFGTVAAGESVIITDVTPQQFRADWGTPASLRIIDDKANGLSVTLDKGPDTPTVYDGTGAVVDSVSYAAGFFPGKGSSAWVDAAHLGAKAGTAGWTLSSAGDAEGSWTSATGSIGSPGSTTLVAKAPRIRITEVAYGGKIAAAEGDGEYVELTNVGNAPQDFTGWTYTGKTGAGTLPLDGFGTVAAGESVIITDVTPDEFRADWAAPASLKIVDDKANGLSVTLDKGPDTPTVYDGTGAVADSVAYQAGFFPGKGSSAWVDAAHLGAKAGTTGWTLSSAGDAEGSRTSATGSIGSPGSFTAASSGASSGGAGGGDTSTGTSADKWRSPTSSGITAQPWPGPQSVKTADNMDFGQNLSALFYVAGATPDQDYMWGVENGDSGAPLNTGESSLFKLVRDANGSWGPAAGWEKGIKLHYSDGSGQPDTEGVTAVGGKVFISTERDNLNSAVSRVSILEFDPTTVADGALDAVAQWELEPDLGPGTDANLTSPDANLGAEAVAFVPDGYLVAHGFRTDAGALYDPAQYGEHDGGVFFAGLEKNGNLYGYVLGAGGVITRVSTFSSGFNTIMDAAWDPSQDALWLDCDNGCLGQTSIVKLDTTPGDPHQGHFQAVAIYDRPTGGPNVNNEGFTVQPASECDTATNTRTVWWADDGDDAGHAIRSATAPCSTPIAGQVGATVAISYAQQGTSTPATLNGSGAYTTPITVSFACADVDAVLQQACPASFDVTTSRDAATAAVLTDTLGNVYRVDVPAIAIDLPWDRTTLYGAGDRVSFLGVSWVASRDVSGEAPGKGNGWVQVPGSGYALWTTSGKYVTGDRVTYQGQIWEASRDVNGETPGKGKFWSLVGSLS